jgi:hypothetical protein
MTFHRDDSSGGAPAISTIRDDPRSTIAKYYIKRLPFRGALLLIDVAIVGWRRSDVPHGGKDGAAG